MKKIRFPVLLLAGAVAAPLFPTGAVGLAAQELPEGVTAEMIEEGRAIFTGPGLCSACHGPLGKGLVGPDLTDTEWFHGSGRYEEIVDRIESGVTADQAKNTMGAIMPARGGAGITDEQVKAVAAYVWSLSRRSDGGSESTPRGR